MTYFSKAEINYYNSVPREIEKFHRDRYIQAINQLDELIQKSVSIQELTQSLDRYPKKLRSFLRGLVSVKHSSSIEGCQDDCKCPIRWHNKTKDEAVDSVKFCRSIDLLQRSEEDGFDLKVPKEIPRPK